MALDKEYDTGDIILNVLVFNNNQSQYANPSFARLGCFNLVSCWVTGERSFPVGQVPAQLLLQRLTGSQHDRIGLNTGSSVGLPPAAALRSLLNVACGCAAYSLNFELSTYTRVNDSVTTDS